MEQIWLLLLPKTDGHGVKKKNEKKKETVSLSGEYWAVGWLHEIEE